MDSFERNKFAGWALAAVLTILGLSFLTGTLFTPEEPAKPGLVVEGVEEDADATNAAPEEKPIEFYLASADVAKGEAQFRKCAVCHTVDKGKPPAIGPNLYGIVGGHHAHEAGFDYSPAMQATAGKTWDWDALSQWIENPKKYIPNNKMAFAGIKKPGDRADLIAFLNSESDNPLPLPKAEEAGSNAGDADSSDTGDSEEAASDAEAAD